MKVFVGKNPHEYIKFALTWNCINQSFVIKITRLIPNWSTFFPLSRNAYCLELQPLCIHKHILHRILLLGATNPKRKSCHCFLSLPTQTVIYRSLLLTITTHMIFVLFFFNIMNTLLHTFVQTHINVNIECNNNINDEKQVELRDKKKRAMNSTRPTRPRTKRNVDVHIE